MNNKLLFTVAAIILTVGILFVFTAAGKAKGLNLLFSKQQEIIITLKNDADIDVSKDIILKIPQVKITNIKYRDKEWSKTVNKYDLPNMENPFKNEITVKINTKTNGNEIYKKLKEMDFIENVQYR